jgi:hypothetical protein
VKYVILSIFPKSVKKIQESIKLDKNNGTLRENKYTFFIVCCSVLLRMRNVLDRSCRDNQNIHFVFDNFLPKIVRFMV